MSKAAKVDEISALRVVVEECQAGPAAQLLGPFSEEELVGIREAAGNSRYSSPIPLSLLAQASDPTTIQEEFEKEGNRRTRILRTYLSERRHFLKCAERLLHAAFQRGAAEQEKERQSGNGKEPEPETETAAHWLATAGGAIYNIITTGTEAGLAICAITAIEKNLTQVESESGWSEQCNGGEELEHDWVQTQIIEAIHNMEIIWNLTIYTMSCPTSALVLAWFRLQRSCKFFSNFEMVRKPLNFGSND